MGASPVREMVIQSHRGPYRLALARPFEGLDRGLAEDEHLIIDARVASIYRRPLDAALAGCSVLALEAAEANKSLERFPDYAAHLIERGIRRNHTLVAVGGGIIQDIAAFLAGTLLRGLAWRFYPTTLLAQTDSCIGSKSSVNVGPYKNQLGTFTPPVEISLSPKVLASLPEADMRSGIGEMIKAHLLSSVADARALAAAYPRLQKDPEALAQRLWRSLEIKKRLIEIDEFDRRERLVMNYGHTFGHALESASAYQIPHGIAVTIGLDMANRLSERLGLAEPNAFEELQPMIENNYAGFERVAIPEEPFFAALLKDKKNSDRQARFVLLKAPGEPVLKSLTIDDDFREFCRGYFHRLREKAASGTRA